MLTHSPETFGSEVEYLAVDHNGNLAAIPESTQQRALDLANLPPDLRGNAVDFGYDNSSHLGEIGGGISGSLIDNLERIRISVAAMQNSLAEAGLSAIDMSAYPFASTEDRLHAYLGGVFDKPIYWVIAGASGKPESAQRAVQSAYGDVSGRNWKHEAGTDKAQISPWNSVQPERAAEALSALNYAGFMFILLGANSPQENQRDGRLDMWHPSTGIMSTSTVPSDRKLVDTPLLGASPTLTEYYRYVLENQVPMVIPGRGEAGSHYKYNFLAVVNKGRTALGMLQEDEVEVADLNTGEVSTIHPSVGDVTNGFDFMYFPRLGSRLRLFLPNADAIDPKIFGQVIKNGNDAELLKLLEEGGVSTEYGALCIEGRVSATNLPSESNASWARTFLPYVLQAAIIRNPGGVFEVFDRYAITEEQALRLAPVLANSQQKPFEAKIGDIELGQLAQEIWDVVRPTLTADEYSYIADSQGDEITKILSSHQGPAEEKLSHMQRTDFNPTDAGSVQTYIDANRVYVAE